MSICTAIVQPSPDGTVHLPIPEDWKSRAIRVKVEMEPMDAISTPPSVMDEPKGFGCLKGKISMLAGFDDPLDDFAQHAA